MQYILITYQFNNNTNSATVILFCNWTLSLEQLLHVFYWLCR